MILMTLYENHQSEQSNVPKEENPEQECRASDKTPYIQSTVSRISIAEIS